MTSLFFVMLVLFILVIVLLHKRMEATAAELEAIKEIVKSTEDLDREYFEYKEEYKKFILNIECQFPVNGFDINILPYETKEKLKNAGKSVKDFIEKHKKTQYLVIIEGQASRNTEKWTDHNYNLSFQRAMSLIKFWNSQGIGLLHTNCEIQITGSGDGRFNAKTMRESFEPKNQRFLIYLIPKNIIQNEDR